MKWAIWTPVLVILFSVVAGPRGIGLFASLALLLLLPARFILYVDAAWTPELATAASRDNRNTG